MHALHEPRQTPSAGVKEPNRPCSWVQVSHNCPGSYCPAHSIRPKQARADRLQTRLQHLSHMLPVAHTERCLAKPSLLGSAAIPSCVRRVLADAADRAWETGPNTNRTTRRSAGCDVATLL